MNGRKKIVRQQEEKKKTEREKGRKGEKGQLLKFIFFLVFAFNSRRLLHICPTKRRQRRGASGVLQTEKL